MSEQHLVFENLIHQTTSGKNCKILILIVNFLKEIKANKKRVLSILNGQRLPKKVFFK